MWAVPYVSTALYRVARRWCWVVAQSGVVPPPWAIYVGVAPTGVRAPLVVPKRCLGGGRGPKSLARLESRQAARLEPVGWRGSSSRAGRTNATPSPSEGAESRGSRRGPGLGDHLAGGPQGPPNNHNGGSPADPGVLRPDGMLGPRTVRDQSPPGTVVQPDGLRPPLFRGGAGEPLFLLLLRELSGKLAWLSVALKASVRLMMQRTHLFLLRAFVTAEEMPGKTLVQALKAAYVSNIVTVLRPQYSLATEPRSSLAEVPSPSMGPRNPDMAWCVAKSKTVVPDW